MKTKLVLFTSTLSLLIALLLILLAKGVQHSVAQNKSTLLQDISFVSIANIDQSHALKNMFFPKIVSFGHSPLPFSNLSTNSAQNVELMEHIGGHPSAIAVQGNYAYVGFSLELTVLDISSPVIPRFLGKVLLPGQVEDIVVEGNYVYLATGDAGLRVIDISNPVNPTEVGVYVPSGDFMGVAVTGSYMLVADRISGLRIVNISNPISPTETGFYTQTGLEKVAVSGNYAYVVDGHDAWGTEQSLRVVDISDPTQPELVLRLGFQAIADVAVTESYAYVIADVTDSRSLIVLDISDPTNPVEVGVLGASWRVSFDVAVLENYAYVATAEDLRIVDVSNPISPTQVSLFATPDWVTDVAIISNYAYIGSSASGLRVIDVSNPISLTEVGFYNPIGNPRNIAVVGDLAYVIDGGNSIKVFSISEQARLTETSDFETRGYARDVTVAGDYAYVVAYDAGLQVINVSDPSHLVEAGFLDATTIDNPGGVAIEKLFAFIADLNSGLRVLDISNPASLTEVSHCCSSGTTNVAISNKFAYVSRGSLLLIVDISNPTNPATVSSYTNLEYINDVAVSGNYAYVASGFSGLRVIDTSDPISPTEIGFYVPDVTSSGYTRGVAVSGNYAYVTADNAGLRVVDISNPASPTEVGFYDIPIGEGNVILMEGNVFVAGSAGGVSILRFIREEGSAYFISGQVKDRNDLSLSGVTMLASFSGSSTTNSNGDYTLSGLVTGTYTLTPVKTGYIFSPTSRTVSVPPSKTEQNFIGSVTSSDLELAQRFAPYLYRHSDEKYWPVSIDSPVRTATLYYPGGALPNPEPDQLINSLYNTSNSYLNFLGDGKNEVANEFKRLVKDQPDQWKPQIYARVKHGKPDDDIVIQYWFFYYDNPSIPIDVIEYNHHEGDWEMIQVVLDSNENPRYAVYAQHEGGTRRCWDCIDKQGNHPKVYIAKGTHASYFKPYTYRVVISRFPDVNDEPGEIQTNNISLALLTESKPWLAFLGHWGELTSEEPLPDNTHNDGPFGPANLDERPLQWGDPIGWGLSQEWDEEAEHNKNKYVCSTSYPSDVDVYDRWTGEHVGRRSDGTVEEQISGSEYIDNSETGRRSILIHRPKSPTWWHYKCEQSNSPKESGISLRSNDSVATIITPVTITLNVPDYQANTVTAVDFVSVTLGISATAVISNYSETEYLLLVDDDGDGIINREITPTTVVITDTDFTSPSPINNLTVLAATTETTVLKWTATGDDGQAGTASTYEIRYYTEPVTTSNWISTTQVINPPLPSEAGMTEVFTVTEMPEGLHYFAIYAIDDAVNYSPLSNVLEVEVIKSHYRLYLPIISYSS